MCLPADGNGILKIAKPHVPHSDGCRVEIIQLSLVAEADMSPEQFPDGFRPKGVG